jgi:Carbohydrate esterase, sialic acid-specific acetylesterase
MKNKKSKSTSLIGVVVGALLAMGLAMGLARDASAAGKLKVFLLAGQSNMDGQADDYTIKFLGKDTINGWCQKMGFTGLHKVFVRPDEKTFVGRSDVWVAQMWNPTDLYPMSFAGSNDGRYDTLQTGFGGSSTKIGPEYSFGYYMGEKYQEQVLLIKYGPGGTDIRNNWRPPSAGLTGDSLMDNRVFNTHADSVFFHGVPQKTLGFQYRKYVIMAHGVLDSLKQLFPAYDEKAGYEIAGLVWFQGYNDVVGGTSFAEYQKCLVALIKDLRTEFKAPNMKAVVGVLGVNGVLNESGKMLPIRNAQRSIDTMAIFKGNARAIESAPLLYPPLVDVRAAWLTGRDIVAKPVTPAEQQALDSCGPIAGQAYHYWGDGSFFVYLGKAFADTMNAMTGTTTAMRPEPLTGHSKSLTEAGHGANSYNLTGRKLGTIAPDGQGKAVLPAHAHQQVLLVKPIH